MLIRTGKIARLPLDIREQLNIRLRNNEPGKQLVAWLNTLPEVKAVLDAQFEGRAISEQNLSEWKGRGYVAWAVLHDCLEHSEIVSEGAEHVDATGVNTERLLSIITARMAEMLNMWDGAFDLQTGSFCSPQPGVRLSQQHAQVIAFNQRMLSLKELLKSVLTLRKSEQRDARLQLDRERLELQQRKQGSKSAGSTSSPPSSSPDSPASSRGSQPAPPIQPIKSNHSSQSPTEDHRIPSHPPSAQNLSPQAPDETETVHAKFEPTLPPICSWEPNS